MAFDIEGARKAGYSDQEIQDYLGQQQQSSSQSNPLNNIMQLGGGIAGGAIGQRAGAIGGALIPGLGETGAPEIAGAYAGGVAGNSIGSGLGNAGADWIRSTLLGDKTVNPAQTLPDSIEAGKEGGLAQAIGFPIGKAAGYAAHPIAPWINQVNRILAKSGKEVNVGEVGGLLDKFKNEVLPEFNKKGMGVEANQAYSDLTSRITNMVTAMKPHVDSTSMQDINKLTLPIADANQMKRNLYQLAKTSYGYIAQPGQEAIKQFARLTRNEIAKQEPGVRFPNAMASATSKAAEIGPGLMKILTLGQAPATHALQAAAGIPAHIIQKMIPGGGGYLNSLLPGLIQAGEQQAKQVDQ